MLEIWTQGRPQSKTNIYQGNINVHLIFPDASLFGIVFFQVAANSRAASVGFE